MSNSNNLRSRCSIELRGRNSWRIRYRAANERLTVTMRSRRHAEVAAPFIETALASNDMIDPWPLVRDLVDKVMAAQPAEPVESEKRPMPTEMKRTITVREYFELWLPTKRTCRRSTYQDYARRVGYVLPLLGDIQIAKLTTEDLVRCRAHLLSHGTTGRAIAKRTVKAIMTSALQRMLSDARDQGYMARGVNLYDSRIWTDWPATANLEDEAGQPDPFEVHEKRRILEYYRSKYLGTDLRGFTLYVNILFETGMRPSECAALKRVDVKLDGDEPFLWVRKSFSRGQYNATKTRRSTRKVHIAPPLCQRG